MEWQPIESAPKDGQIILGWIGVTWLFFWDETWRPQEPKVGFFDRLMKKEKPSASAKGAWCGVCPIAGGYAQMWVRSAPNQPTHWMPLPSPPQTKPASSAKEER